MSETDEPLGYIVGGGLKEGLRVRLTMPADQVQEGSFVVCDSGRFRYYGLVTDLHLGATDPRFADESGVPPAADHPASPAGSDRLHDAGNVRHAADGPGSGRLEALIALAWVDAVSKGWNSQDPSRSRPCPRTTRRAQRQRSGRQRDLRRGGFEVGHTIEQGHPVRLDLKRFVQRSSGIFGATGTGKSFLTRMVLAGLDVRRHGCGVGLRHAQRVRLQ